MDIPEVVLVREILEIKKMTIRKLADVTKIKPLTMIRFLGGNEDVQCRNAYIKLEKYKNKLLQIS